MLKKLNLLILAAGALIAFGAPPAAQAEGPLITDAFGNPASTIFIESENLVFVTESGAFDCTRVELHVDITTNADTTAHGHGIGAAYGTRNVTPHSDHCGTSSGLLFDFTSVTLNTIHLTRHLNPETDELETTGTASFTYTYDLIHPLIGPIGECTMHAEATVTKTGADEIRVTAEGLVGTGANPCPKEGAFAGDFTVTDENGEPAVIH